MKVRRLIRGDYDAAFENVDLLIGPVTPAPAFKLGEKLQDPLAMYMQDIFTLPPSLAGIPAVNVPCGMSEEGLPLGLQVCAPHWGEPILVRAGHAFEAASGTLPHPPGF